MNLDKTLMYLTGGMLFFMLLGYHLPKWAIFLATVSLCYGTVVLGMILLVKSGLVSFGNGFYYCIGAYTAGTLQILFGVSEIMIMISSSIIISAIISFFVGYLLRNYRDIFFAMLSLAISMILYGLLAKSSALGSTDGFNLSPKTFLGMDLYNFQNQRYVIFALTLIIAWICASIIHLLIKSPLGKISEAIKDNELRVEYIGESVKSIIHTNYVISAILASLGGCLMGLNVGHIDPEMTYWTTSGEFVFITLLSGTGSVLAPFLGATIFETVRSFAYEYSPNTWQMVLGITMLLVIVFLPGGIWSLFNKFKK